MPYNTLSSNETPQMQVYAVIGGMDYEGEDFSSLKLFDCFSTANAYEIYLVENEGYDYSRCKVLTVNMKSDLCDT
jgi:hypothetical protein